MKINLADFATLTRANSTIETLDFLAESIQSAIDDGVLSFNPKTEQVFYFLNLIFNKMKDAVTEELLADIKDVPSFNMSGITFELPCENLLDEEEEEVNDKSFEVTEDNLDDFLDRVKLLKKLLD